MICPKCKELGQKSKVYQGVGHSTALYCPPYYDEEGEYHKHDTNSHTLKYSCTYGHQITFSLSNKCPNCDFGHDDVITVKDGPVHTNTITVPQSEGGSIVSSDGTGTITIKGE